MVVGLLVVGCAIDSSRSLVATRWVSTEVSGYDLVPTPPWACSFWRGGTFEVSASCNIHYGEFVLEDDVLDVRQLASTEMACETAALAMQDTWIADFFRGHPSISRATSEMSVRAPDGSVTITFMRAFDQP